MVKAPRDLVTVVLAAATLAGCGVAAANKAGGTAAGKPTVLTLASPAGGTAEIFAFAAEVGRISGGHLKIRIRNGWRWGQPMFEAGVIHDIQAGRADLGVVGTRAWDGLGVKSFQALGAPLLIDSYPLEQRVLQSRLPGEMLPSLHRLGLVGLGIIPGPLRRPFGYGHRLLGPSSYRGLAMGVQQSRIAAMTFRSLGAASVVYFPAGGFAGRLDGIEKGVSDLANGYDKPGTYLTDNVALWPRPWVVFANAKALARLTPGQRSVLRRAASDTAGQMQAVLSDEQYTTGELCRAGTTRFVNASVTDMTALRRAVQPVYETLDRDRQTREFISQVEAMRASIPEQRPLTCSRPPMVTAERPGALDGVYEFTVTPKEMTAAHADPSEMLAENFGAMVFVFDRGRFADTQVYTGSYGDACTWGYGHVDVASRTLTLTFIDGGGLAPNSAQNRPGDQFTYTWSLYHDVLSLGTPANPPSLPPTPWRAVPWRRLTTTPSASHFPRRCPPPANALPR